MTSTILSFNWKNLLIYVPTVLFILIILWSILSGFRRGLRKSIILLINMAIAIIISSIIFYIVFGKDFDHQIITCGDTVLGWFKLSFQELFETNNSYDKLSSYLYEIFSKNISDSYVSSTSLVSLISTLMAVVESTIKLVMVIVLVIFYHLVKFVLYIIYLIFFKEGRRKRRINKKFSEGETTKPYNGHRCFGMLVGLFRGSVVALLLFSFIGSFFYILSGGYYSEDKEQTVITVNNNEYDITEYYDIVNRYGTVGIGKILESIKNTDDVPIYLLAADYITKGSYTIENPDGTTTKGSLYSREELAPVVGLVKEVALLAIKYDVDISQLQNSDYLIYFMSMDNTIENIAFCDRLDSLIDKYNFGSYTIYLGQCLVKSIADAGLANADEESFTTKLLDVMINGENKISVSNLVSNENISSVLHLAVKVASNYDELNTFFDSFSTNLGTETLAYGIKKANPMISSDDARIVNDILIAIQDTIESLSFFNDENIDGLLSDIVVIVFEEMVPDYSLEGVSSKDDTYSIYNISWKESISDVFGKVCDLVTFVSENEVSSTDDLVPTLLDSLSDANSSGYKLLFGIVESDILGVFLNADGFKKTINDALADMHITLPEELVYGSYKNSNGEKVNGEIYTLLTNLASKVKPIYDIFTNEELSDTDKLGELFSDENNILDAITNSLDSTKTTYSRLLHYMISDLLLNMDQFNLEVKIYVPDSCITLVGTRNVVTSEELLSMCDLIGSIAPNIFVDEIDYSTLLTSENIDRLMGSEILKSTIAITAYDQIVQMEELNSFIPSSLALDTDENITANLNKWVGGEGELDYIVKALNSGDLINRFFQSEDLTTNDLINIVLELDTSAIENAMKSNLLNTIVTGKIQEVNLDSISIIVPSESLIEKLDGLDRINPSEMTILLSIIQTSGLDEVINATENQSTIMIEKMLNLSNETEELISSSNILNATITSYLTTLSFESGTSKYQAIIPNECLIANKSVPMISYEELDTTLNAFAGVLNGNYDFQAIDFNNILTSTVIDSICNSKILSATIINLLLNLIETQGESISSYIQIPELYKNPDLVNGYSQTKWITHQELKIMLNSLNLIGLTFNEANEVSFSEAEIMKIALNAKDANSKLNQLLESDVLYTSISHIILTLDAVKVVNTAKTKLVIGEPIEDSLNNDVIYKDELIELFSSVEKIIGSERLEEGITFDSLSSIITIDYLNENNKLNAATINSLLDSTIIEATIANLVVTQSSSKLCVIDSLNFTDSSDENIYNWLHVNSDGSVKTNLGEIRKLVDALDKLNMFSVLASTDEFSLNSFLNLTDEQIDSILQSDLIHATFIEQFYTNESIASAIKLPVEYSNVTDAQIKESFTSLAIVKNQEIKKVIKAISCLQLDLDNLEINVNLVLSLNDAVEATKTKLDFVADCDIVWYTLTNYVLGISSLNIPKDEILASRNQSYLTDLYLNTSEVSSLISLASDMGLGEDLNATVNINKLLNLDISSITNSKILWYTISTKIFDLNSISIPKNDILITKLSKYEYVTEAELTSLMDVLRALNITDLYADIDSDSILNKITSNNTFIQTLCNSRIIWYTLTTSINKVTVLVKPNSIYIGEEYKYITREEIESAANALKSLGAGIANTAGISLSTFTTLSDSVIDSICNSSMLEATFIDMLYGTSGIIDNVCLPDSYKDVTKEKIISSYNTLPIVIDNEINKIIKGINALGLGFSEVSLGSNMILGLNNPSSDPSKTKLEVVSASSILWLTLSTRLFDITALNIPVSDITDTVRSNTTDKYVTNDEIKALINTTSILNISDLTGAFDVNSIINSDLSIVCDSYIIWNTISQNIKSIPALSIPSGIKVNGNDRFDLNGIYLSKSEITHLTSALQTLNLSDMSSFDFNNFLSNTNSSIWSSAIIRYTASLSILDVSILKVTEDCVETINGQSEVLISESEMTNFMSAITNLNLTNISTLSVDLGTVIANISTLLNSDILKSSISYQIFNGNQIANIEDVLQTQLYNNENDYYVLSSEAISSFIGAASSLNMSSYEFDSSITPSKNTISAIRQSSILLISYDEMLRNAIQALNSIPAFLGGTSIEISDTSIQSIRFDGDTFIIESKNVLSDSTVDEFVASLA